jgi:S-adenosylmethionine/arginine decarboxylase-like enzyme
MKPNITNTSQTLVVNSYYGFSCSESNRYDVNKKIEEKFSSVYLMSILEDISITLETKILHTSKHTFKPSGTSLSSIIESNETVFGSSGVAHLNESHISFHSYFENSIKNIIILRLELHISSCSRKSVYFTLDNLMGEQLFNSYDGLTLDFFHRGIDLEKNQENHSIITSFLENKSKEFNVKAHDQIESFSHYKIVKHKEKIGSRELYDYFYNYLI